MTGKSRKWRVDLSGAKELSLFQLSELMLFTSGGLSAVRTMSYSHRVDKLCSELAEQALKVFSYIPVPEWCESAFATISKGNWPSENLDKVEEITDKILKALTEEYQYLEKAYNRARGIRSL